MKSNSIFMTTSLRVDWLYKQMIPELRVAKLATFFIICAQQRYEEFNSICHSGDKVVTIDQIYQKIVPAIDTSTVYEISRKYEAKYEIKYLRDIVQLCPISSASFMGYADNDVYSVPGKTMVEIYNEINRLFDYFEKIFSNQNFYAAILRPKGLMDTVATYVAIRHGVPSTFFHSSYFGSDAVWANGPFMGADFFENVYRQTSSPAVISDLKAPNNVWRKPAPPSFLKLAKAVLLMFWNYFVFFLIDLKKFQKSERTPFSSNLRGLLHAYSVQKYLHRESSSSLEKIFEFPYFYFALPFEPEYTVQSLCKDFADVNAIIRQAALSLPAGYKLVLKEHQRIGNRSIGFYEKWRKFPNVIIANPTLHGVSLIRRSMGTITLGGSTPMEAAQLGIPSIVFGANNPYHFLPSVFYCDEIKSLENLIDQCVSAKTKLRKTEFILAANKFKSCYETVTFDANDTVLTRSGCKFVIPKPALDKSIQSFIKVIEYHHNSRESNKGG